MDRAARLPYTPAELAFLEAYNRVERELDRMAAVAAMNETHAPVLRAIERREMTGPAWDAANEAYAAACARHRAIVDAAMDAGREAAARVTAGK